ncbi:MAG: M28 family peptidase, partial [Candidatus Pacebacteria bacterium]|nr:M28 family peptidase [Candidatus Paceibacterota bacterium]
MSKLMSNVLLTVVLGVLCVLSVFFFNRAAAPQPKILATKGAAPPDYERILERTTQQGLVEDLRQLCAADTRFPGTAGNKRAADYIAATFRSLGYRTLEQPFPIAVPVTHHAALLDATREPLRNLELKPLLPNWFRTCTIPGDGLTGTVVLGSKGLAREFEGKDLRNNLVLLPLGTSWTTVAGMGVSAVLYYDDGRDTVDASWDHHRDASIDIPRFLVTGDDPTRLDGKSVTIRARVDVENETTRNVAGILEVKDADEIIILSASYDSYSYTPDLAPGGQQACSPAILLSIARHLAGEKESHKRSVLLLATSGRAQGLLGAREFVRALGTKERPNQALHEAETDVESYTTQREIARAAHRIAADKGYWALTTAMAEEEYWKEYSEEIHTFFNRAFESTMDGELMRAMETLTQTRVEWVRKNMPVTDAQGGEAPTF